MTLEDWQQLVQPALTFEEYVENMKRGETWGDALTLIVCCSLYQVRVKLYSSIDGSSRIIAPPPGWGKTQKKRRKYAGF